MHVKLIRHSNISGSIDKDWRANPYENPYDQDWRTDIVEMVADGKPAGYIQLNYVPSDTVEKRHPEVWQSIENYFSEAAGVSVSEWQDNGRKTTIEPKISYEQAFVAFRHMKDELNKMNVYWQPLQALDRPVVTMVKLYTPGPPYNKITIWPEDKEKRGFIPDQNYQGKGLGMLLYNQAARWMAEYGMTLRGDVIQREAATDTWRRLMKQSPEAFRRETYWSSWAECANERKSQLVMDGEKFGVFIPRGVSEVEIIRASSAHESARPEGHIERSGQKLKVVQATNIPK